MYFVERKPKLERLSEVHRRKKHVVGVSTSEEIDFAGILPSTILYKAMGQHGRGKDKARRESFGEQGT